MKIQTHHLHYITLAEFPADEILPLMSDDPFDKTVRYWFEFGGFCIDGVFIEKQERLIKVNSLRYSLFKKNRICVSCGLTGTTMRLQCTLTDIRLRQNPHFNLYGIRNNQFIMMTKDHVMPVSKGGRNTLENLQTMCFDCNMFKTDTVMHLMGENNL